MHGKLDYLEQFDEYPTNQRASLHARVPTNQRASLHARVPTNHRAALHTRVPANQRDYLFSEPGMHMYSTLFVCYFLRPKINLANCVFLAIRIISAQKEEKVYIMKAKKFLVPGVSANVCTF